MIIDERYKRKICNSYSCTNNVKYLIRACPIIPISLIVISRMIQNSKSISEMNHCSSCLSCCSNQPCTCLFTTPCLVRCTIQRCLHPHVFVSVLKQEGTYSSRRKERRGDTEGERKRVCSVGRKVAKARVLKHNLG